MDNSTLDAILMVGSVVSVVFLMLCIAICGIVLCEWAAFEQHQLDARRNRLEERRNRPF